MFFWTEEKEEIYILKELVIIIKQYFPELINKFEGLTDVRNQSYVKYRMKVIFIVILMALMCEIKSMHGLTREFNTEEAIKNIAPICKLELEDDRNRIPNEEKVPAETYFLVREYYDEENANPEATFSIVTIDGDKLIGTVGLERINQTHRTTTLGIFIGDKEFLNKGYGTEAIRLLLDYGFNYMNLHSIHLNLMSFNIRAQKCYEKCGFKETGRIRESRFINGRYYDVITMDILANEFQGDYIKNKNI